MKRVVRFALVACLIGASLLSIVGCSPDQQEEANAAMDRANEALAAYDEASTEIAALLDEVFMTEETPEGAREALALLDEVDTLMTDVDALLLTVDTELSSIGEMNVDPDYLTYAEMLLEVNRYDVAYQEAGLELMAGFRALFNELAKESQDEAAVDAAWQAIDEVSLSMDEIDAEAIAAQGAADQFFEDMGFTE